MHVQDNLAEADKVVLTAKADLKAFQAAFRLHTGSPL